MSIIEKIVHWFSPPEDTCIKGPTPEESADSREAWRNEIHGSRHEVQKMQALARESTQVFHSVNENAHKVTDIANEGIRVAKEAIRLLEEAKQKNRSLNK